MPGIIVPVPTPILDDIIEENQRRMQEFLHAIHRMMGRTATTAIRRSRAGGVELNPTDVLHEGKGGR